MSNAKLRITARATFARFLRDTSGAVTVDWVVLTAAIAGIGIAVTAAVRPGVGNASEDIDACLDIQSAAWSDSGGGSHSQRLETMKAQCAAI
ncbi:hypothetical protein [uncultured Litoreibacter sp.]|uniref:Flp family type IVb pilin n=1 Tax=uncultured Litoreibacter sp. TaxID=1392394 RepID=UPI002611E0F5|nr:hypothetical protein [uncultured Litoreibacter sp.]